MKNELNTIAITGSTGGIGKEIAFELAKLGKNLIFVDRNINKIKKLKADILKIYPNVKINYVLNDLSDINSVKNTFEELIKIDFDAIILNAGVYNLPTEKLNSGYNNIFQINFLSQYYLAKKLIEAKKVKKVVMTGSIAYALSKIKMEDIDYSTSKNQNKIYSNSKKYLMLSLIKLTNKADISFAIANPGITLTTLTAHFPKYINWFVKFGMKIIFPSSKKASRNIVYALLNDCPSNKWVSPKILGVWGKPKIKKLKYSPDESNRIFEFANKICDKLDDGLSKNA